MRTVIRKPTGKKGPVEELDIHAPDEKRWTPAEESTKREADSEKFLPSYLTKVVGWQPHPGNPKYDIAVVDKK